MWNYPQINPVAFDLGFAQVHWYGLMYLFGVVIAWFLFNLMNKPNAIFKQTFTGTQINDIAFYSMLGVILGGRLGYVIFYSEGLLQDPLAIIDLRKGGMSFHGGFIGVLVAFWFMARRYKLGFFEFSDMIAPLIPIGLGLGRIGNFINGELWGKVTDSPLGMTVYDIQVGGFVTKYPTQLLEAFLEGLILFLILITLTFRKVPTFIISGMFCLCYGVFRFFVEFYRMPDQQLGYLAFDWLTMGQVLSTPMIVFGVCLIYYGYSQKNHPKYHR